MTVIELSDEHAAILRAKAAEQGLSLEVWFERLAAPLEPPAPISKGLVEFFRDSPLVGLELEFTRDRDGGRDLIL